MVEQAREFVIPAYHARAWRMQAGQRATIGQSEGHQVGDLIAFNAHDLTEFLSTSHTRRGIHSLRLAKGHSLYTNHRVPILDLVEDTVGVHDLLVAACDPYRYKLDFGVDDHRSCRMNFVEALAEFELPDWRIPDPVNLFQNTPVQPDWGLGSGTSPAKPGDYVTLLARMDAIVSVSACPQDLAPTNAGRPTDLWVKLD
jgi:uncharacterized protein YcgI (DUF1989 family)